MDASEILARRLTNLRLTRQGGSPAEVADWFGAMQAQDLGSGKWSIGIRTGQTEAEVDLSLGNAEILRTWPMRGTIHIVAAQNARWLLELTGVRALNGVRKRWQDLGLDQETAYRAADVLASALQDGPLTRSECRAALEDAGIDTSKTAYHLLWHTSQLGITCLGPNIGREQTFVLLDQWAPVQRSPDDPLATLARMYFQSHGPTTAKDFQGWSGLTMTSARAGISAADLTNDGDLFYVDNEVDPLPEALLLPGFDEYLLGFKDRTAFLTPDHMRAVVPGGNGVFRPTAVWRGKVIGTWRRVKKSHRTVVTISPLAAMSNRVRSAFDTPAAQYERYVEGTVDVVWDTDA